MDRALAGEILDVETAIDDAVDEWHTAANPQLSLAQFLGLNAEEYELWARSPSLLRAILAARRLNTNVAEYALRAGAESGMRLAARGAAEGDYERIRKWLSDTGRV